jgi:hypothetical protein
MNKLYTILIIVFLAGCYPQYDSYQSASNSFRLACEANSIETSLISAGDKLTITATCTKAK